MKIIRKKQQNLQWLCIIALISLIGYSFLVFPVNNPIAFFKQAEFVGLCLSLSALYMFWQVVSSKSKRFPVTVVDTIKIDESIRYKSKESTITLFGFVGYGLSVSFTLMVMIYLGVALNSGTGKVLLDFNHFNEM